MTCWRRLRDWNEAGVWDRLHLVLLDELGSADQIDWECACLDGGSVLAKQKARDGHTSQLSSTESEATNGEARLRWALERCVFFSGVGRTEFRLT